MLDAELNALSTGDMRAFFAWREQTSTDGELDGDMSPSVELGLLAAWRAEMEARRKHDNLARDLDAMNRARFAKRWEPEDVALGGVLSEEERDRGNGAVPYCRVHRRRHAPPTRSITY